MRPMTCLLLLSFACGDDDGGASAGTTEDTSESDSQAESGQTDSSSETESGTTGDLPDPLPPLSQVLLTTERTFSAVTPFEPTPYLDPRVPSEIEQLLAEGYGDEQEGAGEAILDVTPDGLEPPLAGPNARLLARFVHLADTQLADDESPARVVNVDNTEALDGAFRPQEAYHCKILDAAARTINAVHAELPLDFVLLGGDNIDSAQTNELWWFIDILDRAPLVHCDSGVDDDPVVGPGNDPKDAFAPVGLDVPWRWVNGNHDILVQGNFTVLSQAQKAIGTMAELGTRDWSQPGGPVVTGMVPPDPDRELLDGPTLLAEVSASGDGHGIERDTIDYGKAYYAFDAGDTLRVVVADTAAPTGGAEGVVRLADVNARLRPLLDQAVADNRWVIVTSHHASTSLSDGSGFGGTVQQDAITTAEWQSLLGEYPNILMHLCGHSHVHRARLIEPVMGGTYWEMITSALGDYPHQMRVMEVRDEDNGYASITAVALDFSSDGDTLAAEGRKRGVVDVTSGWRSSGAGDLDDRNVRLWIPLP